MYFRDFNACLTNAFTFPSLWTSSLRTTLKPPKTLGVHWWVGFFREESRMGPHFSMSLLRQGAGRHCFLSPLPQRGSLLSTENSWFHSGLETWRFVTLMPWDQSLFIQRHCCGEFLKHLWLIHIKNLLFSCPSKGEKQNKTKPGMTLNTTF